MNCIFIGKSFVCSLDLHFLILGFLDQSVPIHQKTLMPTKRNIRRPCVFADVLFVAAFLGVLVALGI